MRNIAVRSASVAVRDRLAAHWAGAQKSQIPHPVFPSARSPKWRTSADIRRQPLYAQGAAKGKRRYRYYVSRDLVRGPADRVRGGWRVAAPEIERAVVAAARSLLDDKAAVLAGFQESG